MQVLEVTDPVTDAQVSQARLKQDGCTRDVIFVVYDSIKSALAAIAKLHGQNLPEQSQKPAKRQKGDKQDAAATLWARQVAGEGLHLKKWRLIIRNLAFKVPPHVLADVVVSSTHMPCSVVCSFPKQTLCWPVPDMILSHPLPSITHSGQYWCK